MKFWSIKMCKDYIDKSRWDHNKYYVPKFIQLTKEEKFNLHQLYTYDQFEWMTATNSIGVTAPFYNTKCSFGEKAL